MDENTQLTPEEQGEAFAAAVENSGVTIDYGGMNDSQKTNYWISMSLKYNGTDWDGENPNLREFGRDIGLVSGETVTKDYSFLGDILLSDADNSFQFVGGNELNFGSNGVGYSITIEDATNRSGYSVWFYGIVKITSEEANVNYSEELNKKQVFGSTTSFPTDWNNSITWSVIAKGNNVITINYTYDWTVEKTNGNHDEGTDSYSSDITMPDYESELLTVSFSIDSNGGGGGYWNNVLIFTATSGISGWHSNLNNNNTISNVPDPVLTVKEYGSGGDGGNGGGGGGGAATVIIRQFTTGKADTVQQIAKAKRHGYGSGGGKGGKGGNGCILIFW